VHVEAASSGIVDDLLGVCVRSESDAVAVGRGGVMVRWDGSRWTREPSPTQEDLYGICATPEGELVAVGGNLKVGDRSLVCQYAAGKWSVDRSPVQSLLLSVAAERGCVRATGFNGDLVERVDGVWRALTAPTNVHLFCIRSFGNVWVACGLDGTVVELEGSTARLQQAGSTHLTGVTAQGTVRFSGGFDGTIMRRDRGGWRRFPSPTREHLWSGMCDGARLAMVGAHGTLLAGAPDALALVALPTREDLHAIDGVDGFAIAVGRRGTIVHLRG
jgi:trimeric autotransporter adhesin